MQKLERCLQLVNIRFRTRNPCDPHATQTECLVFDQIAEATTGNVHAHVPTNACVSSPLANFSS